MQDQRVKSESIAHSRVDESSIHPEGGVDRIEEDPCAAHLRGAGRDAGPQIPVRKRVEQILRADGERVRAPVVGDFEIAEPFRPVDLIVERIDAGAAEFAVATLARGDAHRSLAVVFHDTRVIAWLTALRASLFAAVAEHGGETGELRGRGSDVDDLRSV